MSIKRLVPRNIKNTFHFSKAVWANLRFGFPARKIKIIGVTGTNGKTTTCQMIARILEESGKRVAMISTINFKLGKKEWVNKTKFTTVSALVTQKFITQAIKERCDYLVLEVSSHSLDQRRVWGIDFDVAVITNVTREHLDYHKTMDEYRKAKLKLFKKAKVAVVNFEMDSPIDFLQFENENKIIYGIESDKKNLELEKIKQEYSGLQTIFAKNVKTEFGRAEYEVSDMKFNLQLPGEFNVENALGATGVAISQGIDLATIKTALEKIQGVSGRMEEIVNPKGIRIFVDYAVTPDSMEKLGALMSGRKKEDEKLIWVFGSCGDRDRGKRPIMGEIVSRYADFAIITNEDPYNEDPMQIIDEVAVGIKNKKEGESFWRILDRREGISKALQLAKRDDIILVTGKGAEETMAIGKKRIPWNDRCVIEEELVKIV